jgi:hypothetical protein
MNRIATLSTVPLMMALLVGILTQVRFGYHPTGVMQWCLAGLLAMTVVLVLGLLLNFAVFAPVYWLLDKRSSRKPKGRGADSP